MAQRKGLINFDGHTLFKVLTTESFTVPDVKDSPSPAGRSSGISPTNAFDAKRQAVGGMIYQAFSDVAGPTSDNFQWDVNPGDVVAVGAIGGGVADITVNGVKVGEIAAAAVCGVLGFWG